MYPDPDPELAKKSDLDPEITFSDPTPLAVKCSEKYTRYRTMIINCFYKYG